jgi:hypothetical protein
LLPSLETSLKSRSVKCSRERRVSDVGAFERVCGVHLSLGARHGVHKKPHLNPREARHHVDTFVVTDRFLLDDEVVFRAVSGRSRPTPPTCPMPANARRVFR